MSFVLTICGWCLTAAAGLVGLVGVLSLGVPGPNVPVVSDRHMSLIPTSAGGVIDAGVVVLCCIAVALNFVTDDRRLMLLYPALTIFSSVVVMFLFLRPALLIFAISQIIILACVLNNRNRFHPFFYT